MTPRSVSSAASASPRASTYPVTSTAWASSMTTVPSAERTPDTVTSTTVTLPSGRSQRRRSVNESRSPG